MCQDNTYIRFDWAIKHILRDKANFDILEGFISVLLGEEIKIEELLESESNQDSDTDKFNRVDIKAKNSNGHLIIVEVQLTRQLYYLQRILYGTCKAITEHICVGDKYVYHGETRFKGIHTGNDLLVNIKEEGVIVPHLPREVFPEYYLVRVNVYDKIPETPLDEWMTYLKTGKVKEDTRTPGLQQVKNKLRYLSMSPKERRAYDAHVDAIMVQNDVLDTAHDEGYEEGKEEGLAEGRAEGREEGRAEGREEGRAEGVRDVVAKMILKGLPDDVIKEVTGICEEEISKIRKQI